MNRRQDTRRARQGTRAWLYEVSRSRPSQAIPRPRPKYADDREAYEAHRVRQESA